MDGAGGVVGGWVGRVGLRDHPTSSCPLRFITLAACCLLACLLIAAYYFLACWLAFCMLSVCCLLLGAWCLVLGAC